MSTVGVTLTPECLRNVSAEPAFIDATQDVAGYAFGNNEAVSGQFNAFTYGGGSVTVELRWYSRTGQVTGNVQWDVAIAAITPGDAVSVEAKPSAAVTSVTTGVNTTAKGETLSTLTIAGASLDSMASGDDVWFSITRNGASTLSGDAVLVSCVITYSDGVAGSPGSGDVVGPSSATNNALPRYDLTTGKLIKNSPVVVDDSGNMTGVGTVNGFTIGGATGVVGPATSTVGRVAVWADATGDTLADGSKLEADLVTGPASSANLVVPVFSGTSGKVIAGSGTLLGDFVVQTTAPVAGNLPSYASSSVKTLQNSGVVAANVVQNAGASTDNAVARFDLATGKVVQNSGVVIDDSNNITGVGTLNTRVIANLVEGPASSTASNIAVFSGTTGKIVADGGQTIAQVLASAGDVDGPASAVSGNITSFNGATGKLVQDSGVSATAHAARHNVGGADALFTGTWAADDQPKWNGTIWVPKFQRIVELTTNYSVTAASNTAVDITGMTIALPRAGTYKLIASGHYVLSGTIGAGGGYFLWGYSGTITRLMSSGFMASPGVGTGCYVYLTQTGTGAIGSTVGSGTSAATLHFSMSGILTCTTAANLTLRVQRNGTPTATVQAGTNMTVMEL